MVRNRKGRKKKQVVKRQQSHPEKTQKDTSDTHELNENLTLAKSYISKLERRVSELENSNKIRNRGDRLHSTPDRDIGEGQLPNKIETNNQTGTIKQETCGVMPR